MSRIEKIREMLLSEPDSEMLQYMLAQELRKQGDYGEALEIFACLQQLDPPHVPSFFMAAQMLAQCGQISDARSLLRTGIEVARTIGDSHAAGEMGELLVSLGKEGE